jgi:cytidylate kinase
MAISPSNPLVAIAIDGPAGAGKSTVARALAERLGFVLLDTGAIYRTLALAANQQNIGWSDGPALGALAATLDIGFTSAGAITLGGQAVGDAIRTPAISQGASTVSAHPEVRGALLGLQRRLAAANHVVVEGRDIGTVVLPDAPLKVFLTASSECRARRRWDELRARGSNVTFEETLAEMTERDTRDTGRQTAPLRAADDAVFFDTTDLTFAEVVDRLERLSRERLGI